MLFALINSRQPLSLANEVPQHLGQYALAFPKCEYVLTEEGEILSQFIGGSSYAVGVHYLFMNHPLAVFSYADHDTLSICFLRRGSIQFDLHGNGRVVLNEGHWVMLYYPGGVMHETFLPAGFHSAFEINIDPSHLIAVANEYPVFSRIYNHAIKGSKQATKHFPSAAPPEADTVIDAIIHSALPLAERLLFIESRVLDLLRLYVRDQAWQQEWDVMTRTRHDKVLKNVLVYMEEHLNEKLSVGMLALRQGIGRSQLQAIFQEKLHKPVHTVVIEKRMQKAAFLLITTNQPVREIGFKVTNISFQSFCTAFRKRFDCTPTAYRKRRGQNPNK